MRRTSAFVIAAFVFAIGACRGEAQPAKSPDEAAEPPPDTGEVTMANPDGGAPPDPDAPPGAVAALPLPKAAVKIVLKGKKPVSLELKPDGTLANGATIAASMSSEGGIKDAKGNPVLVVKGDAVNTISGATIATFSGENELANVNGDKLTLADNGALTWTASGKESTVGKVESAGTAKRAALVGAWMVLFPPPSDKATEVEPAPKPKRGKPGPKPRGKKK